MWPTPAVAGRPSVSYSDLALGIEGNRVRGRHTLEPGDRAYCALSWAEGLAGPADSDGRRAADRRRPIKFWRRWLGRARIPDHQLAGSDPALRARDQGPDLHADRRDGRRAHDIVARDAGRGAQLGLPLHLDARHDLHAPGAPLPEPRLGGRRVHAVRRRHRAQRGRRAADHVRDRRAARPDRVDARPPLGLRRAPSGADRQRGLRPAPERRLRRRPRLDPAAHPPQRAAAPASVADRPGAGRSARRRSGRTPTRGSGRRAARPSTTSRPS